MLRIRTAAVQATSREADESVAFTESLLHRSVSVISDLKPCSRSLTFRSAPRRRCHSSHWVFTHNRDRLADHNLIACFFNGVVRHARDSRLTSDDHFTADGSLRKRTGTCNARNAARRIELPLGSRQPWGACRKPALELVRSRDHRNVTTCQHKESISGDTKHRDLSVLRAEFPRHGVVETRDSPTFLGVV